VRSKLLAGLCALVVLSGCEQKLYEKHYSKPSQPIDCLQLASSDPLTKYYLHQEYNFTKECPFLLRTTSHYVSTCTSAKAKALGSDFDGFLRLELYEGDKLLYRNQADFKGCLRPRFVHMLFGRLRSAMKLR